VHIFYCNFQAERVTYVDSDLEDTDSSNKEESEYSDSDIDEVWDDVPEAIVNQDIETPPPLPEPKPKRRRFHLAHSLLKWSLYFLLIWQSYCHLSDNGLIWLLRFFLQFLKALNLHISNDLLTDLIAAFPCSLYMVRQYMNLDRDNFTKFVVCPKCTKCYKYDECLTYINGHQVGKHCTSTSYLRGRIQPCGSPLVRKITLQNNSVKFYPLHYYCYNGIINPLEELLRKSGFPEKCEEWRINQRPGTIMADIHDGQLWKTFKKYKGKDYLDAPRNYGLMLNFDFFQPMKRRKDYSVGVLYLVLLNLPRSERFKWENVIVVGIIPSMGHEPKLNEFLKPAIIELKALWSGVYLKNSLSRIPLKFRAAVLCTSSDIPASRKLCGIKGHSAVLGCSRCLKKFPGNFGEKRDYSGFERNSWEKRTNENHRKYAKQIRNCKTKVAAKELSKKHGITHYSSLLDLEYFDVIRFCAIDPMHNLFLGTAKYVFKLWVNEGILTAPQLRKIDSRIQEVDVPPHLGRLPKNISANYGSFTAEQWKNWTIIYSLFALKDIIENKHLRCWQTFTLACRYLCKPIITEADIIKGDGLLFKFCKEFQSLSGGKAITPKMHLHCHLREVIADYGPIQSFWCFSFERYNGIIGSIVTNNISVELQLMRKLCTSKFLERISLPDEFKPMFNDITSSIQGLSEDQINSNSSSSFLARLEYYEMDMKLPLYDINWLNIAPISLPTSYRQAVFVDEDILVLLQVYQVMFPNKDISQEHLSRSVNKYSTINIYGLDFGSQMSHRSSRSCGILASWPSNDGNITQVYTSTFGTVDYFFTHSLITDGDNYNKYIFACVTWYQPSNDTFYTNLNPLQVFCKNNTFPGGSSRFLPVQRISAKCSYATVKNEIGEQRYVISPLVKHFA